MSPQYVPAQLTKCSVSVDRVRPRKDFRYPRACFAKRNHVGRMSVLLTKCYGLSRNLRYIFLRGQQLCSNFLRKNVNALAYVRPTCGCSGSATTVPGSRCPAGSRRRDETGSRCVVRMHCKAGAAPATVSESTNDGCHCACTGRRRSEQAIHTSAARQPGDRPGRYLVARGGRG